MDNQSCHSSGDRAKTAAACVAGDTTNSHSNSNPYLKQLNKVSYKISKPQTHPNNASVSKKQPDFDNQPQLQPQNPQNQPPVYNINKNDFRDVVQRLTGSPAHERFSAPPPIHPPKPQSSRLQRIRPPPLPQISNRPPPPVPVLSQTGNHPHAVPPNPNLTPPANVSSGESAGGFVPGQRQSQPLSPLPPFPSVHAAAESPVSAYMRYLHNSGSASDSDPKRFPLAPFLQPRWNHHAPSQPPLQHLQNVRPPSASASITLPQFPAAPSSPIPFGCLPSPKSPYPLLSPSLLFSPTAQLGFQQLPLSPTLPVPTPMWNGF